MSQSDPVIVCNGIAKSFRKNVVLKSIDGVVEEGKAVGLLGENGSGKTTLFRILLDVLMPDSGKVSVLGNRPDGTGRIRQRIGYIPERPAFHPFMRIGEVLKFRSKIFKDWDPVYAAEAVRNFKLDPQTKIQTASKGTLAKLAWICATAYRPPLLLLDEPTSGLDLLIRESVLNGMIHQLQEQGKTIIVANHRMEEMMNLIDEFWLLADGKIITKVKPDDLRDSACRITGRLRKKVPDQLKIIREHCTGNLVSWVTMDRATLEAIRELGLLDQIEVSAVSPEVSLKALMKGKGE